MSSPNYTAGIRRTIRVYGPVDPKQEARRQRHAQKYGSKPMRPHSGLNTSVRERLR